MKHPTIAASGGTKKVIIMGAAGRDFHNFNVVFRDNVNYQVVAFTAAQIPGIADRRYPASLAGKLYPDGIAIHGENELETLIASNAVDEVVLAYSDLAHADVMHLASRTLAGGADFRIIGPRRSSIASKLPVISVCAVRTGSGKDSVVRRLTELLKKRGLKAVVIRHPMPYGNLAAQAVQRFASVQDCLRHQCTIEEREEYEQHIAAGVIVYAGVDYGKILARAEQEADVILWDGGNNDWPFFHSDLEIVIVDPHRAGHELSYHPGETNLRRADVVIINKLDSAPKEVIERVTANTALANDKAAVIRADSRISVDKPELIRGKRVLVVEDGPTLTHGEMRFGAGTLAAQNHGAAKIVDPRTTARGSLKETMARYPWIGNALPAMGYSDRQLADLTATINDADCDSVVIGTPIDLASVVKLAKPHCRVRYDLVEIGTPTLDDLLESFLKHHRLPPMAD